MHIKQNKDFKVWFEALTKKQQLQIAARLERIQEYEHFGDVKHLGKGLCELRWKNGWRVYFVYGINSIVLIIGGHKNEQEKNIKKARLIISRYTPL